MLPETFWILRVYENLIDYSNVESFLKYFLLSAPRLFAIGVIFAPLNIRPMVSGLVRNCMLFVLAAFMAPISMNTDFPSHLNSMDFFLLTAKELAIGAFMGIIYVTPFWSLEIAGAFIDNVSGNNMASQMNPATKADQSILGAMFQTVALGVFYASGFIFVFFNVVAASYTQWPLLAFYPSTTIDFFDLIAGNMAFMFELAVIYVAPAILIMFISDFALGLMSRIVPAMNVFMISFPLKGLWGILMLTLYFSVIIDKFREHFLSISIF